MPYRKKTDEERSAAPSRFYCVTCGEPIPEERIIRKAVTCCKQHANDFKNAKRRLRDTEKCRLCNRPSNAEERADYNQWRKERKAQETAKRREQKKLEKEAAKQPPTPIEEHLGTVAV